MVLAEGQLQWDEATKRFDPDRSDAARGVWCMIFGSSKASSFYLALQPLPAAGCRSHDGVRDMVRIPA